MKWPDPLIKDIALRRAVLFVGAGVSRHAQGQDGKRPPLWKDLLLLAGQRCAAGVFNDVRRYSRKGDLLTATEILVEALGHDWHALLEREFVTPRYQPAAIHESIFRLDLRFVLTGNVDKIYEAYALRASQGTIALKTYDQQDAAAMMRERENMVLKVHGTIDNKAAMIFGRSQYAEAKAAHGGFFRMLEALFLTNTVLFLGCSLDDPDIQMLLERSAQWAIHSRPHYLCAPGKYRTIERTALKKAFNIEIITYSAANDHAELATGVEALVDLVEDMRASTGPLV